MAAKEKNKPKPPPPSAQPQSVDLLSGFDAPAAENDPPPSFNTNFLPPPPAQTAPPAVDMMPPPAFDAVAPSIMDQTFLPPPPIDSVLPPPPPIDAVEPPPPAFSAVAPSAPPAASAPFFEDLMDHQQPNHLAGMQAVPPPQAPPAEMEIDESILAGLDPKEREELLAEQRKIMEQIEKEKQNNEASGAAARAMAFNRRSAAAVAEVAGSTDRPSSSSRTKSKKSKKSSKKSGSGPTVNIGEGEEVPLHGEETTQQAIKDGTALVVQCMSCQNWMQVAENANLMFCPVCQVVSPVEKAGAASAADMEAAAQLAADAELAAKLQNEEYARGSGGGSASRSRQKKAKQPPAQGKVQSGQSWYDWIVGTPVEAPASVPDRGSAEIRGRSPGLVLAETGAADDGVSRVRSYDESESLMGGGGGGGAGARVAESKSMFSCVTDSISTAANQMTAVAMGQDEEGNVHGVDSSSLLAMSNVSRQRE